MTTDAAIFNAVCDGIRNAEEHWFYENLKPTVIATMMSSAMHRRMVHIILGSNPINPPENGEMETLCGSPVTVVPSENLWAVSFPQRT